MVEGQELEQQSVVGEEVVLNDQSAALEGGESKPAEVPVFDIDGEQVNLDQIKQWKSGHMMQDDYTRKTTELAQEREKLKPYGELDTYLQANPEKAQAVYNYLSGKSTIDGQQVDPRDMKLNQMEQTMNSLVQQTAHVESQNRLDRVKNDPKFEGVFNDPQMEEVLLATAMQKRDLDLTKTAENLFKTITGFKAKTKLETEGKITENFNSPTRKSVAGRGTMTTPKDVDLSSMSWADADKVARSMM